MPRYTLPDVVIVNKQIQFKSDNLTLSQNGQILRAITEIPILYNLIKSADSFAIDNRVTHSTVSTRT